MADAPAPAPAPAPAAAPEPAAAPLEPAAATVENHWMDSLEVGETRDWAEAKSMRSGSFEDVVKSYHNLEKVVGADKAGRTVTLLGDDATPEQAGDFYTKLGRPENAAGYNLAAPEGEDGAFAQWAGDTFFEAGLTNKQTNYLAEKWGEFVGSTAQTTADSNALNATNETAALRKEWGAAFDDKTKGVDNTAVALGMTPEQLAGLKASMGPAGAMKFIDSLGAKMGEDGHIEGDGGSSGGPLTPSSAALALSELTGNKEFMDAWVDRMHPGHKAAVEKKAALSRLASGVAE